MWHSRLLVGSELFQRRFYRERLSGAGQPRWAQWLPLIHYVFWGYRLGLNPSARFNGVWYRAAYPDVARAGLNPLIHYLRSGRYEGRLPYAGAAPAYFDPLPSISQVDWLSHKLWQGFRHLSEPELARQARDGQSSRAALELASWAFTDNRVEETAAWLESEVLVARAGLMVRRLVGLAKAYTLLGRYEDLKALLDRSGVHEALGANVGYAAANIQAGPELRLAPVNRLLVERGLVPLTSSHCALAELRPACLPPTLSVGEWPLISVVVPAYNAGAQLTVALESLLKQTWPALEILVVDDASTDDTRAWGEDYAGRDARVRYFRNERNLGAYPTRNRGLAEARGEFVTVHDSDDWSHPQKLEAQVRPLLDNPALAASVSYWVRVSSDLRYLGSWMMGNDFVELNPSSWLIRRQWLEVLGGWDNVNVGADSEFARRLEYHLGREALHFLWPDTPLAFARVDSGTLTRSRATHLRSLFHGLRRLYAEASYWWLREHKGTPVMTDNRPFPVPLGNIRERSERFGAVVAGNFAVRGKALAVLLGQLEAVAEQYHNGCLLHWPDYAAWHGNTIADEVFAFCQARGLHFAHAGLNVTAPRVILLAPQLWQNPTTETVCVDGLEAVTDADGNRCDDQKALCDYFRRGGTQVVPG